MPANLLFTVSAPRAVLIAGVLTLENVASEVLFHTQRGDTGVFATGPPHTLWSSSAKHLLSLGLSGPFIVAVQNCPPCFRENRFALSQLL